MFPFLDLKILKIPMYGLCIAFGVILAGLIGYFLSKYRKKNFLDFIIISAVILGFGFIFAKLFFIIVTYPIKDFFMILGALIKGKNNEVKTGGFVFYGGVIGGILGYFIGVKIAQCKITDFIDIFAVLIPFIHGFGRIGCFCAGCCYGIPYEGPFSVVYKTPLSSVPTGVGIFPVQLLEALLLFILFIVLLILFLKNKKFLFFIYLIVYGLIRFFLEFLRFDFERGFILGLSVSQFISIILIFSSIVTLLFLSKKRCR